LVALLLLFGQRGPHLAGLSDTGQTGADDRGVEMLCVMASSGSCLLRSQNLAETEWSRASWQVLTQSDILLSFPDTGS